MSKEMKKIIPELRFPEYSKGGDWIEKMLDDLCFNISSGKDKNLLSGEFNLFGSTGIIGKTETPSFDGDYILVARVGANAGLLNRVNGQFGVTDNTLVVNLKEPKKVDFIFYTLCKIGLNKLVFGSGQPLITGKQLKELIISIPKNPKEQQKIASCLSSLDDGIAANSQKLDALKDHKKGLMQNLFPQEGETVPKYRFAEFEGDGDWVRDSLGNLGHFLGGGTPNRSNSDYWIGNIPWISSSDISDDDIHNISITRFINEIAIKESATKIIPKGSILFVSRVGVGKLAISKDELCTSQDFTSFVSNAVLNYFIGYYFSANKNLLQALNQGTSIKGFSKSDLENSELIYPTAPQEQQKIASCLSTLDELITAQTDKIEQLKLHKKGLMQGLFPKVNIK
jgi:type I restriction enzyme S subunit